MVITTDAGDDACKNAAQYAIQKLRFNIRWHRQPDPDGDCVKGWNCAWRHSTGDILIAISDDFLAPQHWDRQLLELKSPHGPPWWQHAHAVLVSDGFVADKHGIMTLPIVTRAWLNQYGYLFYPEYRSMFCDTDLTARARRDGVLLEARHLLFTHRHYTCGSRQADEVDERHGSPDRWRYGEELFNRRLATNFPK